MKARAIVLLLVLTAPMGSWAQQAIPTTGSSQDYMGQESQRVQDAAHGIQQQEMLQAQQNQADAERDQANEMWQQRMDEEYPPGQAAGDAAAGIANAIIEYRREQQQMRAQQAEYDKLAQESAMLRSREQAQDAAEKAVDALMAELSSDLTRLQTNTDATTKLNSIVKNAMAKHHGKLTRAEVEQFEPLAQTLTVERNTILADLARVQKQLNEPSSTPASSSP